MRVFDNEFKTVTTAVRSRPRRASEIAGVSAFQNKISATPHGSLFLMANVRAKTLIGYGHILDRRASVVPGSAQCLP